MHDIRWIRENPMSFDSAIKRRGLGAAAADLIKLDADRRHIQTALQELQTLRNETSKKIGVAKGKGEECLPLIQEVSELKQTPTVCFVVYHRSHCGVLASSAYASVSTSG